MNTPSAIAKRVVLTRDTEGNRNWKHVLTQHGRHVYELPCIETVATAESPQRKASLQELRTADWLIFTSAHGVRYFLDLLAKNRIDRQTLTRCKIAAVGQTTADEVTARGLAVSFTPSKSTSASLAAELPGVKNHRLMIPGPILSDPDLTQRLIRRGAAVNTVAVYETRQLTDPDPQFEQLLSDGGIGYVIFASPSAASAYAARLTPPALDLATSVPSIAIGESTLKTLASLGFTAIQTASSPSVSQILKLI